MRVAAATASCCVENERVMREDPVFLTLQPAEDGTTCWPFFAPITNLRRFEPLNRLNHFYSGFATQLVDRFDAGRPSTGHEK